MQQPELPPFDFSIFSDVSCLCNYTADVSKVATSYHRALVADGLNNEEALFLVSALQASFVEALGNVASAIARMTLEPSTRKVMGRRR